MPYCQKCGKEVNPDDVYCPKCGAPLKEVRRGVITEELDVPFPDAENPELQLTIGVAGYMKINPGEDKLVQGTITYDVPEWRPEVNQTPSHVSIKQRETITRSVWGSPRNDWDVKLGSAKPYRLMIKTAVGRGLLNLGALPLTDLYVDTSVSQNRINFQEPNPQTINMLRVKTGVGETTITGLLNANFKEMRLDGGVGSVKLGFTGEGLRHSATVRVEGGVGELDIRLKEGIPAIFEIDGFTTVNTQGRVFKESGGFGNSVYVTDNYQEAGEPALRFRVSLGLGGVSLKLV